MLTAFICHVHVFTYGVLLSLKDQIWVASPGLFTRTREIPWKRGCVHTFNDFWDQRCYPIVHTWKWISYILKNLPGCTCHWKQLNVNHKLQWLQVQSCSTLPARLGKHWGQDGLPVSSTRAGCQVRPCMGAVSVNPMKPTAEVAFLLTYTFTHLLYSVCGSNNY